MVTHNRDINTFNSSQFLYITFDSNNRFTKKWCNIAYAFYLIFMYSSKKCTESYVIRYVNVFRRVLHLQSLILKFQSKSLQKLTLNIQYQFLHFENAPEYFAISYHVQVHTNLTWLYENPVECIYNGTSHVSNPVIGIKSNCLELEGTWKELKVQLSLLCVTMCIIKSLLTWGWS